MVAAGRTSPNSSRGRDRSLGVADVRDVHAGLHDIGNCTAGLFNCAQRDSEGLQRLAVRVAGVMQDSVDVGGAAGGPHERPGRDRTGVAERLLPRSA
jgi:hypothetical protein